MRIALVAGETSGDLLASILLDGVNARWPKVKTFGIGGTRMATRGFDAWFSSDRLAVRGYVEVLRHYREIVGIRQSLKKKLLDDPPDVFIGVDAPDFNLDLARDLRRKGIKTIQYVSPSIWAWRGERIHQVKEAVDHVLCIFPFEPEIFSAHGISASYVGHPLAQVIPLIPNKIKARMSLSLTLNNPVVAVLPGSRSSEIQYIGSTFIQTIQRLLSQPDLQIVLPTVPSLRAAIDRLIRVTLSEAEIPRVLLLDGQSHTALEACDVALVASGTATLEAALFKKPMVIAYKMNALSWLLMRGKRYQQWVGLPNILCQEFIVPEFLQSAATPSALSNSVLKWLNDPIACNKVFDRFTRLHHDLQRDSPTLLAQEIEQVISQP